MRRFWAFICPKMVIVVCGFSDVSFFAFILASAFVLVFEMQHIYPGKYLCSWKWRCWGNVWYQNCMELFSWNMIFEGLKIYDLFGNLWFCDFRSFLELIETLIERNSVSFFKSFRVFYPSRTKLLFYFFCILF